LIFNNKKEFDMYRKLMPVVLSVVFVAAVNVQGSYALPGAGADKAKDTAGKAEEQESQKALAGKVAETMNAGGYTYIKLDRGTDKIWVAVPEMKVKVGEELVFAPGNAMPNFRSESLKRTFDLIVFSSGPVTLPGTKGEKADKKKKGKAAAGGSKIKVEKASGANAYTVAELYGKSASLDKKEVTVRGKVVKVSVGIMGKNWVHIQDGTGEADKGTDRIIATTDDTVSVGDTITATGILAREKDFGYGYKYDVIIEKAAVKK
jgi:hypothetical protein